MSKQIHFRTRDPQLWKDFEEFILTKYGVKHTVMAAELEKAIYCHLAREGWKNYIISEAGGEGVGSSDASTHTKKFKPREERFFKSFYQEFFMDEMISNNALSDFIRRELGIKDWRAVRSWRKLLISVGWIESPGPRSKKWFVKISPEKYDELLGEVVG